jgi:sugar phosphate isomerase/epimerase
MAELLARTEKIKFVHDTYWTAGCGVDPAAQIRRFGNRLLGIHLRDLSHKKKLLDVVACNVAVGDGVIDFEQVLFAAREVGCEYTVIEQKTDKPYDDVKLSYGNLMKIKSRIEE